MSNPTVKNCSYAPLGCYNTTFNNDIRAPVPVTQFYIVPDYQTYGYQTLTGARSGADPSCSGYFTLDHAYGNCNNAMTYVRRSCI